MAGHTMHNLVRVRVHVRVRVRVLSVYAPVLQSQPLLLHCSLEGRSACCFGDWIHKFSIPYASTRRLNGCHSHVCSGWLQHFDAENTEYS